MKNTFTIAAICLFMLPLFATAQNSFPASGSAGIGTASPNASSILEMNSTTQGMLAPRMTKAQRDAILTPATGLLIYQTTNTPGFYFYNGSAWAAMVSNGANKTLSNLTASTAVNVDLLPSTANTYNLGAPLSSWKNIYSNGDVYIDGFKFLSNGNSTTNVFVGNDAGKNSTVSNNVGVGHQALYDNSSGYDNVAIGTYSLKDNLAGYNNTAIGNNSLYTNTNGDNNSAMGDEALSFNSTGNNNTAIGKSALSLNTGGSYNVALGSYAGDYTGDNTYCTFIGYSADKFISTNFTNSMALGSYSSISASNQVRVGSSSVTSIGGYVGWTNISDGRYKKEIKENVPGLSFINKLKPVTYHLDIRGIRSFLQEDGRDSGVNTEAMSKMETAVKEKEKKWYTGFIAQDVEKAATQLGYEFSGVDKPEDGKGLYGLRYAEFVVPMVKALQELSRANDEKDARIDNLQQQIDELKTMLVSTGKTAASIKAPVTTTTSAGKLEQNIPNPAAQSTLVKYYVPAQASKAVINIVTAGGQTVRSVNIATKGNGQTTVQLNNLNAGTYFYSLIIDGKVTDTKQMVVTH